MKTGGSLARRLAILVSAGLAAIWLLAVIAMGLVLKSEQRELFDTGLRETARVFRPLLLRAVADGAAQGFAPTTRTHGVLVYQLLDRQGQVLAGSGLPEGTVLPDGPVVQGFETTASHVFYTTGFGRAGRALRLGDPRTERADAYRDSFLAFLAPMVAILPLGYLLVGWIGGVALRPLERLRAEIATRGRGRLDPLDPAGQPAELAAITATLNGFMIRLSQALDGERAFATNAAHELRTPIAVALAQTQRLRAELGAAHPAIDRVEDALQRMRRLVTSLLQLARSEAGLGTATDAVDLAVLVRHVVGQHDHGAAQGRTTLRLPPGPVPVKIDPDAFALIAGNLIDNALRHSPVGSRVEVALGADARLRVTNDGAAVDAAALARLTGRFHRGATRAAGSLGIGLHIAETLAQQAGGSLALASPAPGRSDGFEAVLRLTLAAP